MQHSIVRFIHKDLKKNGKGKEANDKYRKLYQNRIKKEKNSENTGKLQSLPKLETECFFFLFCLLFMSYVFCSSSQIVKLLPRARYLFFFNYWIDINFVTAQNFTRMAW